ncbi:Hypothetical_protein [Hexamita inflata]|uniref:Hypothetical_protein n=1 Tax=Hexamita inflata TaxID=28002 RepID=A0AA86P8Z6_9EUKA|nr:Hypothetical protein HINF_LOCUS19929 [Hexamita inflata]
MNTVLATFIKNNNLQFIEAKQYSCGKCIFIIRLVFRLLRVVAKYHKQGSEQQRIFAVHTESRQNPQASELGECLQRNYNHSSYRRTVRIYQLVASRLSLQVRSQEIQNEVRQFLPAQQQARKSLAFLIRLKIRPNQVDLLQSTSISVTVFRCQERRVYC